MKKLPEKLLITWGDPVRVRLNEIIDYLEERLGEKQTNSYTCVGEGCFPNSMIPNGGTIKIGTITLLKPEWWEGPLTRKNSK